MGPVLYSVDMISLLLVASLAAFATDSEVEVEVDAAGAVVGRMFVPAPAADVREVVGDPVALGRLSPDVVSVSPEQSGPCVNVTTETKGLFRTLFMKSRRCPTVDGWQDSLVQSDDFSAYSSQWSLREVAGGTEVTVRTYTEVDLPVPTSVVQGHQKRSVGEVLENLLYKVLH